MFAVKLENKTCITENERTMGKQLNKYKNLLLAQAERLGDKVEVTRVFCILNLDSGAPTTDWLCCIISLQTLQVPFPLTQRPK